VVRSRWPRALIRRTQKPFSEFVERDAVDQPSQDLLRIRSRRQRHPGMMNVEMSGRQRSF
jgi:hypothetical protein